MTLHACIDPASSNPLASFLRKPRANALLVPWTFSHPGDPDFDAFGLLEPASGAYLGSNRLAAVIVEVAGCFAYSAVATLASVVGSPVGSVGSTDSDSFWR